jgi:predicted Zn-dependent peptidase
LLVTAYPTGDPAPALKAVEQVLFNLPREGASAEELEYARRREIGSFLFEVETYAGQARALGEADVIGDYRTAVDMVDRISRITAQDIAEFARRAGDPARVATAVLPSSLVK